MSDFTLEGTKIIGGAYLLYPDDWPEELKGPVTVNPGDFGPPTGEDGCSGEIHIVCVVVRCPGCGALAKSQPRIVTKTEARRLAEAREVVVDFECGICGYGASETEPIAI